MNLPKPSLAGAAGGGRRREVIISISQSGLFTDIVLICRCPAGAFLAANLRARAAAGGCLRALTVGTYTSKREYTVLIKLHSGSMFSARDLETRGIEVHVSGNAGWSEFHWTFHATMRKDGSAVTTHGVETQVYRKGSGKWRLVHVHYSEDRQPVP